MSLRLLSTRLFKHGRFIIQNYCKRDIHINILEHGKNRGVPSSFKKVIFLKKNLLKFLFFK